MRVRLNVFTVPAAMLLLSAGFLGVTERASAQTFLGPIHYVGEADSPFDAADPTFVLEDFEDGLFNIPGVSSDMISVIGPFGNTDSVDADDGVIDGSGTNGHSAFANGQIGITFTFDPVALDGLPTHAAIVWTDGAGTTSFEAFGADGVSLGTIGPSAIADTSFFGGTGEDHFFGVIHAAGIGSIKITNTAGGIEVDHLQFSFATPNVGCTPGPDINCDGVTNGIDLAILLGQWGPCPAPAPGRRGDCLGDLDGNGIVNGFDLAILLAGWTT